MYDIPSCMAVFFRDGNNSMRLIGIFYTAFF